MTMSSNKIVLYAKKKDGLIVLNNKSLYDSYVNYLEEGEDIEITMHKVEDYRTARQNRLYWKYLREIASTYGEYTALSFHDYFKSKFLSYTILLNGEEVPIIKSTADLDKKSFSAYIEQIIKWAAENLQLALASKDEIKFLREE